MAGSCNMVSIKSSEFLDQWSNISFSRRQVVTVDEKGVSCIIPATLYQGYNSAVFSG